jgi:NAD(P)H-flavin reductase
MIATGTGVTPLRSMMRAALMAGSRTPISLILGVRHEQDILYETEMHAAAGAHDSIRFEPTLSQPAESWQGRRGYVQAHVRALWAELEQRGAGAPHAYVCGLQRMVGSVRELLRNEMGVDRLRVHSERYD